MNKIFLLACIFTIAVLKAQVVNIVENGGFEQTRVHMGVTKFTGWNFHSVLAVGKLTGYQGDNAARVYANNGSFRLLKLGEFNVLPIENGASYKLSYWVKGDQGTEKIEPMITWYDSNGDRLSGGRMYLGQKTIGTNWSEKTIDVTAPSIAASAGLSFRVSDSGMSITIDEVSVVKTTSGATVPIPTGLEITTFQREIEINWHKGKPNTKWEVFINGVPKIVTTNSYIATGLEPNTNCAIKLRTVIGGIYSSFLVKNKKTASFNKTKDDPMRVPHLRTLAIDGKPLQTINLFYTDLYNANATISYEVDGQIIPIVDNKLTFPKIGKQTMKTIITEGNGYEWEIDYNLNVK